MKREIYRKLPEITAGYLKELVDEKKVNILGGCCGTHFSHKSNS